MTDKLKCPFCGEELERCSYLSKGITNPVFVSRNRKCKFVNKIIDSEIWQALIDGKKAQDALKGIKIRVAAIRDCVQDGYTQLGERNRNIFIALELFKDLIKEITSITKQDE